jgi:predicted nuclease of predicted toxin-antitoxin system
MIKFLIDADLPLSLYQRLRELGYTADDVRELGLGQAPDEKIFEYAVQRGYCLISADKGFANLLRFPLGSHKGIIVARFPRNCRAPTKVKIVTRWLSVLRSKDITGHLVIIEAHGVRIRRHKPQKRRRKP